MTEALVDIVAAGIIDPTKVTHHALAHAASVAGLLLTSEAMMTESDDESMPPQQPESISA